MEFGILGPVEARAGGTGVRVGGPREQKTLALLLLSANRAVSAARLTEALWGEDPPPTSRSQVSNSITRLRRRLAVGRPMREVPIVRAGDGFAIELEPDQLDTARFERFVARAGEQADHGRLAEAAATRRAALTLWRGPALAGLDGTVLETEAYRLEEQRLACLERRIELDLALGRHHDLIGELAVLVAEHPMRENLVQLRMRALYQAGRRQDALDAFAAARAGLAERAGLDPGPELVALQQTILRAEPTGPVAEPATVTVRAVPGRLPVPAQLLADVAHFTGRAAELTALRVFAEEAARGTAVEWSGPPRGAARAGLFAAVVAVTGTAGVGKTALALHWAHQVRDRFPDGQLYVDLRGYSPGRPVRPVEAVARFLQALGVPAEEVPVDVAAAAALYRSQLAGRRMLVVLDNAADSDQARPLLPGSAGCAVVVTSRDSLGGLVAIDGARRLALDALRPADAHALLAGLVRDGRVAAEPYAVDELAHECAYLPLALRIAGANLAVHPHRSISGYVADLRTGGRLAALRVDGEQQAAVRAAFDASYTALPPTAQRMFRLLGLVPGPSVGVAAAAALAGTTPARASATMDLLAAAHLVERAPADRYVSHDLLRHYAFDRVGATDRPAEAAARLFTWYLNTVDSCARLLYPQMLRLPVDPAVTESVFTDHHAALDWLDAERANLVALVTQHAEHGPGRYAYLLADALRGYLWLRSPMVDWLTVAQAGLAAAVAGGDPHAEAASRLSLADAYEHLSRYDEAVDHYQRALTLSQEAGWLEGQAAVLGNLGGVYRQTGRPRFAADHYTRALALNRAAGRLGTQATNLGNLAAVDLELGRIADATGHLSQAIALHRETGTGLGEAVAIANRGEMYRLHGRLGPALDELTRALALHRRLGHRGNEPNVLDGIAATHRDAGRYPDALAYATEALEVARDIEDRRLEADVLITLATVEALTGRHLDAADHHRQALDLARQTGSRYCRIRGLTGLAAVLRVLGDTDQALHHATRAATSARDVGYRLLEGQARTGLAEIHLHRAAPGDAVREARQALVIQRDVGHRLGEAETLFVLGLALRRRGEVGAAVEAWRQALAVYAEVGVPAADRVRALIERESVRA